MTSHEANRRRWLEERQPANDRSRAEADHHRERWTIDDTEFIVEFWLNVPAHERDEAEVARALGRTIEACRVQAHYILHGQRGCGTIPQPQASYIGAEDEPDDQWWSPDYYREGR